jgi:methyl-accepting chemotaxis protein
MKATIRNKLVWGFAGVLLLLASVAAIGVYAAFSLRHSAQDATRVGGRLNAMALEIQVHTLEAQRRVKSYLLEVNSLGSEKARELYLDEADFEIAAIDALATKAVTIAPSAEKREKFLKIVTQTAIYKSALAAVIKAAESPAGPSGTVEQAYEQAAGQLHDDAEDGEVAGREASQASQIDIDSTSRRATALTIGFALLGMLLGAIMSFTLSRAILIPVEHLKDVAENVSLGNLEIAVRRYSNDEIGDLADSFSRMVTAVKFFRMEAQEVQAGTAETEDR